MSGDIMADRMSDQIERSQAIADDVIVWELLDSCRAEIRCLFRQATGKDPSEATGSVRKVLARINEAMDRIKTTAH